MPSTSPYISTRFTSDEIRNWIHHAAHFLPSQGPINVFVHHNTLHAFEHFNFDEGVQQGGKLFGCHAYLPEEQYHEYFKSGRIRLEDLDAVLLEDLGDDADILVAHFGTRYALRLAMLKSPLHTGSVHELRWVVAETNSLQSFHNEVDSALADRMINDTRKWVLDCNFDQHELIGQVLLSFGNGDPEKWTAKTWEAFVLTYLWRVCQQGARFIVKEDFEQHVTSWRHRDALLELSGTDADLPAHEVLIQFCALFLDQGFSDWPLPDREAGFYQSFLSTYSRPLTSVTRFHHQLRKEVLRHLERNTAPVDSIMESMQLLGVTAEQGEQFILNSLLALRGWAGMVWQMETNAEWTLHPAPKESLMEFLAVRLILDRVSLLHSARESIGHDDGI